MLFNIDKHFFSGIRCASATSVQWFNKQKRCLGNRFPATLLLKNAAVAKNLQFNQVATDCRNVSFVFFSCCLSCDLEELV